MDKKWKEGDLLQEREDFKELLKTKRIIDLALDYEVSTATIYTWIREYDLWDFYQKHKIDKRKKKRVIKTQKDNEIL